MKIRIGFVSNSSSSSFCIFGTTVKQKDAPEENQGNWTEYFEELFAETHIEIEYGPYEDRDYCGISVGRSPNTCPDDITMGEWKNSIRKELSDKLNREVNCSWIEDAWYDG